MFQSAGQGPGWGEASMIWRSFDEIDMKMGVGGALLWGLYYAGKRRWSVPPGTLLLWFKRAITSGYSETVRADHGMECYLALLHASWPPLTGRAACTPQRM